MKEYDVNISPDQNPIIIKLKEIADLVSAIGKLQENQIEEISKILFEISWRVNELPWSLKDHEKYKLLTPWKGLGFITRFLVKANDSDKKSFIERFKQPEELRKLEEAIQNTLNLYNNYASFEYNFLKLEQVIDTHSTTNDINGLLDSLQTNTYYTDIAKCNSKTIFSFQQFLVPFMDEFYFEQISKHLNKFFREELDYTKEENRIALFRLIELIGENVKNLSEEFLQKYPFVPWKDLANIRNAIEHPEQGEKVNKNITEILEDTSGSLSLTLSLELKQLQELKDSSKSQSFKFIKSVSSNSILTLKENAELVNILKREAITQAKYETILQELVNYIATTPKKDNKQILEYLEILCNYKHELTLGCLKSFTITANGTRFKAFIEESKSFYKKGLTLKEIEDKVISFINEAIESQKDELVTLTPEYFIGIFNGAINPGYPGEETFNKYIALFCQENNGLKGVLDTYHTRIINKRTAKPQKEVQGNNIGGNNNVPVHTISLLTRLIATSDYNTLIDQVRFYHHLNKLEEKLGFPINKRVWFDAYKNNITKIKEKVLEGLEESVRLYKTPELELIRKTETNHLPLQADSIRKEIEKVNNYLGKLTNIVMIRKEKSSYIYQLICEYYIERVGDIAITLLDYPSFNQLNNPESIAPNNLLFLNNLRKVLAHRRFELDESLVNISIENITNYMQVDLRAIGPVAQADTAIVQSYRQKMHMSVITEELVSNKQDDIRKLMHQYGIKNLSIIGKLVGSNIGILSDLDLVIIQDTNSGIIEQLRFAWLLSGLLNCTVKTWTQDQLKESFYIHLSDDYKRELEASAVSFDKFLQDFETKKRIKERNLYYRTYSDTIVKENLRDKFNTEEGLNQFWDNLINLGYITVEGKVTRKVTELKDHPEIVIEPYPSTLLKPVYDVISDGLWRSGTYVTIESLEQSSIDETKMSFANEESMMRSKVEEIKNRSTRLKQEKLLPVGERVFHSALQNMATRYAKKYSRVLRKLETFMEKECIISLIKEAQELLHSNKRLDQMAANSFRYYYRECSGIVGMWYFKDFIFQPPFPRMFQVKEDGIHAIRDNVCDILKIIPDLNDLIQYLKLLNEVDRVKNLLLQKLPGIPDYGDAKNKVIHKIIYPLLRKNFRNFPFDNIKDYFPEDADYIVEIYNDFTKLKNGELDTQTTEEFNKKLYDYPLIAHLVNQYIAQDHIDNLNTHKQLTDSESSIAGLHREFQRLVFIQHGILSKHGINEEEFPKAWQQLNMLTILIPEVDDRIEFATCYMEYLKKERGVKRNLEQLRENDSLNTEEIEEVRKAVYVISLFDKAENICAGLLDNSEEGEGYIYQNLVRFAIMPSKEMLPNWVIPRFPELPDIYDQAEREVQRIFLNKIKAKLDRKEYISPTTLARYYFELDPERVVNDQNNHFHGLVEFLLPHHQHTVAIIHNTGLSERGTILEDYFKVIENYILKYHKLPEKSEVNNMLFKHNITYKKRINNRKQEVEKDFEFLWNGFTSLTDIQDQEQRNNLRKQALDKIQATYKRQIYNVNPSDYLDTIDRINMDYRDTVNLITQKINRLYNLESEIAKDEAYIIDHEENGAYFQSNELRKKLEQKQEDIYNLAEEIITLMQCKKIENYYIYTIFKDIRHFIITVDRLDYVKEEIRKCNKSVISGVLRELQLWAQHLTEDERLELDKFKSITPPVITEKFEKLLHYYLEVNNKLEKIIMYKEQTIDTILSECKGEKTLITREKLETYAMNSKDKQIT